MRVKSVMLKCRGETNIKWPCIVCMKGAGNTGNSLLCTSGKNFVDKVVCVREGKPIICLQKLYSR